MGSSLRARLCYGYFWEDPRDIPGEESLEEVIYDFRQGPGGPKGYWPTVVYFGYGDNPTTGLVIEAKMEDSYAIPVTVESIAPPSAKKLARLEWLIDELGLPRRQEEAGWFFCASYD